MQGERPGYFLLDPASVVPSIGESSRGSYIALHQALRSSGGAGRLAPCPDQASLILAPIQAEGYGPFLELLRRSKVYKRNRAKICVYCLDDFAVARLPGVYPSIDQSLVDRGWALPGHYVSIHSPQHRFKADEAPEGTRDLLFSFVGSTHTHPVRKQLLSLSHSRALIDDSQAEGEGVPWWQRGGDHYNKRASWYEQVMVRTKFALCPRGKGPSSWRLYQTMEAGCVPVVISDDLVLPKGPAWEKFVIRVPETELLHLPSYLEKLECEFEQRSELARAAWHEWFSPKVAPQVLFGWCEDIMRSMNSMARIRTEMELELKSWILPKNLKRRLRFWKTQWRSAAI